MRTRNYANLIVLLVLMVIGAIITIPKVISLSEIMYATGFYDQKITIVHTSDVHGHIVFDDQVGGYYSLDDVNIIMGLPIIKHFTNQIKQDNQNVLFLDSGDLFHGTNEANIEQGKGVVEAANLMGYTAMTPGNHDFNFGLKRLKEIKSEINFPMLCANAYQDGELIFDEYKIIEMAGKRIGLFGLTNSVAVKYINSREKSGLVIEDYETAAERTIKKLKDENVDLIILISHIGNTQDRNLVQAVAGIDLVLCGHLHMLYQKPERINDTYLVSTGGWTTHLGVADLYFKKGKVSKVNWKLMKTKDKTKAVAEIDSVAQKYHEIALESAKEIVGHTNVRLNGIRSQVRSEETNFGNLLSDAMREMGKAEIALMNGGGIRESIPEGPVNLYQIGKSLPFVNSLVTIRLKGDLIYRAIERGLKSYPNGTNGAFLQVSGISYQFDGSKPAGKRLVEVTRNGEPLDKNSYYTVALNDYLYNGGDYYEEFLDAELISMGGLLKDVLTEYLREKQTVEPENEGRIRVIKRRY